MHDRDFKMSHNTMKPAIFGCSGLDLTLEEKEFFSRVEPLGFILFTRNCQSPDQIKKLTHDLRACVPHTYVPILIDQEGGRVARLGHPHWRQYPPAGVFGAMADEDMDMACWAVEANAYLMGVEMANLGINVDCAPVMDLLIPDAHHIIGNRAFHESIEIVATLAIHVIRGLQRSGVTPIIKHIPGHGRALVDSHEKLPTVSASFETLRESDFSVFRQVCQLINEEKFSQPWGMTAHIIYDDIDADRPATQSEAVIDRIVRRHIDFRGALITDCLTMKALTGSMGDRAIKSIEAGCDIVLHCSGDLTEMIEIAAAIPAMTTQSYDRLRSCQLSGHRLQSTDDTALWAELNYHLKAYWGDINQKVM